MQNNWDQEQSLDGNNDPVYRVVLTPIRRNDRLVRTRRQQVNTFFALGPCLTEGTWSAQTMFFLLHRYRSRVRPTITSGRINTIGRFAWRDLPFFSESAGAS